MDCAHHWEKDWGLAMKAKMFLTVSAFAAVTPALMKELT
jgi:hypothetical protein